MPFVPISPRRSLEGVVRAERYVVGEPAFVVRANVPLRKAPDPAYGFETEALFGERVTVFEEANGWAWVQLARDGYVGYMASDALRRGAIESNSSDTDARDVSLQRAGHQIAAADASSDERAGDGTCRRRAIF